MYILDSNILIYSADDEFAYLKPYVSDADNAISYITYIEVLGYHKFEISAKQYFEQLLPVLNHIPIEFDVILKATELRQERKMSLGDAIIAATALHYDLTICTRNTVDFSKIIGLKIYNPII
jgi:toxin FitB